MAPVLPGRSFIVYVKNLEGHHRLACHTLINVLQTTPVPNWASDLVFQGDIITCL